jgi:AcrR family transcriptional regulator
MAAIITKEQTKPVAHNSREIIFQRSLQLFTERGYDGTSIDDIRQAAGFKSKASFYTHFKSKEELAGALLTKILEDEARITGRAFQAAEPEPLAQFLAVGRAFIEWGLTNPREYAFCFLRTQQEMLIQGRYSAESEQSNDAIEQLVGQIRARYPVRQIANKALTSMIVGLISKAVIDQGSFGQISLEAKIDQIVEMALGVLFTEKVGF